MNGFTKKSIGTLTLGEKLKKLRSERRMSLNEVSRIIMVQIKYLEYLEQGEYDKLPADVYTKGFLRNYADFLGVEERILLKLYNKEKGIKKNLEKSKKGENSQIKSVNISSFVLTPKKIVIIVGTLLVFLGLFLLYKEVGTFASTPRLVVLSPEDGSEVSGNSLFVEGITEKDASLFINGQPILVGDDGKFKENITLQSGINSINIKSVNKFKKETSETVMVRSNWQEKEEKNKDNQNNGEGNGNNLKELILEIRVDPGPVWLSASADDNLVFSGTMLSGAVQTFRAKNNIVINSGKGEATFAKFNGQDIGALGKEPGAVREVIFDKNTRY